MKKHILAHPESIGNIKALAAEFRTTRPTIYAAMQELGLRRTGTVDTKSQAAMLSKKHGNPHETPRHREVPSNPLKVPSNDPEVPSGYDPLEVEDRRKMLAELATRGDDRNQREAIMDLTRVEQLTGARKDLGPGPPMDDLQRAERLRKLMEAVGEPTTRRAFKVFDDAI